MLLSAHPKIKTAEKIVITKHLSTMLKAGIPLEEAFFTLLEQNKKNSSLQKILTIVLEDIQNGQSLEKALKPFEYTFGALYVNLVKVSEESGTLEENLEYLSMHMEKASEVKKKVQAAMLYPIIVLLATFGVGGGVSLFVFPKLIDLFNSLDFELPATTKVLLWFAAIMRDYGVWIFLGGFLLMLLATVLYAKLTVFKKNIQDLMTKIPAVGPLALYAQLEQFCRNLGMLIKSGVPVDLALITTASTLSQLTFEARTTQIAKKIATGKKISEVMIEEKYGEFPVLISHMIAVGEKTGKLDDTLLYLADYYAQEIDSQTKNITTLLEPLLLLFVGLMVGFIALAVISPIYGITSQLR